MHARCSQSLRHLLMPVPDVRLSTLHEPARRTLPTLRAYRRTACGIGRPSPRPTADRHAGAPFVRRRQLSVSRADRSSAVSSSAPKLKEGSAITEPRCRGATSFLLDAQILQIVAERIAEIVPGQSKFHGSLKESELVAGIVARSFKFQAVNGPVSQHVFQGVGELYLATAAWLNRFDALENFRRQDIPAYNREVGWRIRRLGLFHHVANPVQPALTAIVADQFRIHYSVG